MNLQVPEFTDKTFTNVDDDVKRDPKFSNFGGRKTYVNPKYGDQLKGETPKQQESVPERPEKETSGNVDRYAGGGGYTRGGGAGREIHLGGGGKALESKHWQPSDEDVERFRNYVSNRFDRKFTNWMEFTSGLGLKADPKSIYDKAVDYAADKIGDVVDTYVGKFGYSTEKIVEKIGEWVWNTVIDRTIDALADQYDLDPDVVHNRIDAEYEEMIKHYHSKADARRASISKVVDEIKRIIHKYNEVKGEIESET
jgi:hypothetical protein